MGRVAFFLIVVSLFSLSLHADRGTDILDEMEKRLIGDLSPQDMTAKMKMVINTGSASRERTLMAWTKNSKDGEDLRMMKFLSPADVKGIALLVLAEDKMYIYMPEFRRVRRIASSNRKDAFVGSDFSYEDLSTSGFKPFYDVTVQSEDGDSASLELRPKSGISKPYTKIEMTVNKQTMLPTLMRMYDKSGRLWKECEQTSVKMGQYEIINHFVMKNLQKKSRTELSLQEIKLDLGLEDEIFTERFLKK